MQTSVPDNLLFHFERRVSERGRTGLIGTLVIAAVFGAIDMYLLHQPVQIGHVVGTWFAGLLILVVGLITIWCLVMLRSSERWCVIVNRDEIFWESPANSGELSFQLSLSDIDKIVLQPSSSPLSADEYLLVSNTNGTVALHPGSNSIPVAEVVDALVAAGIRLEAPD